MRRQKGFSLIELLIVVAIILIIAAIAIPNLIRSRIASNNSAAAATVRTINTSEATYNSTYTGTGYATLATLGPGAATCTGGGTSTNACILDATLGCTGGTTGAFCTKDAFQYTVTLISSGTDYVAYGMPIGTSFGNMDYCSAPDMVIHFRADVTASGTALATDSGCTALSPL
jgi:prepilin-type N-terminal cleavage/methylation domain-containing protein